MACNAAGHVGTCSAVCDSDGGSPSVPLESLATQTAHARCAYYIQCGFYADEASCEAQQPGDNARLMADVAAGKARYDGVAAATCLASYRAKPCTVTAYYNDDPACQQMVVGTAAASAPCTDDEQCASDFCVVDSASSCGAGTCCPGTCAPSYTWPTLGQPCKRAIGCMNAHCTAGPNGTDGTCQPFLAPGAACDLAVGGCPPPTNCLDGACLGPVPHGGDCSKVFNCADLRDFCDPTTMKCVTNPGVGATCKASCLPNARCDATSHTCVARASGDPCTAPEDCLAGNACIDMVCRSFAPVACP
jgi:hypothetical protein